MNFQFEPRDLFGLLRKEFGPLTQRQVDAINRVLAGGPAVLPERIDRDAFFDGVRERFGKLTQGQVDGFNAILTEWEKRQLTDPRWLAYMLATAWHETGKQMQPVIETQTVRDKRRPSVDTAIRRLETAYAAGRMSWVRAPYWRKDADGLSWLGRGLPQCTHKANYVKLDSVLGAGLSTNPDRMFDLEVAVLAMFEGMIRGTFTGKRLADFFDEHTDNARQARRIINALESADTVKGYYDKFLPAINAARTEVIA